MPATKPLTAPTYNKAQEPETLPDTKLYPIIQLIGKKHPYWVSRPILDKLHLCVRLKPSHFVKSYNPENPHQYGFMIMQALATGQAGSVLMSKYHPEQHFFTKLQVGCGDNADPIYFEIKKTPKAAEGLHTLIIQMNPQRLGEVGICDFLENLNVVTGKRLIVGAMLSDAHISRIDVAIDVIGIALPDLLISSKYEKVRHQVCCAADGALETIYLKPATTPAKPGKTPKKSTAPSLKIYDKRRQLLAAGLEPLAGKSPMTRIEITKQRFGNKALTLEALPSLPNVFDGVGVGLVRSAQKPLPKRLAIYEAARRGVGRAKAAELMGLSTETAETFDSILLKHPSDVLNGAEVWKLWPQGLAHKGVNLLVEAAQQKCAAIPLPPGKLE